MADNKGIPAGKRRYAVTLTVEHVERFRALAKSLGMPPGVMSQALDDTLRNITISMESFRDRHAAKGSLTIGDLFEVVGQQLNEKEGTSEEKEEPPTKHHCPVCDGPIDKHRIR